MTGFIANEFLSRNRVSLKEAFEGLELCERKLSCTVLRGLDGSNPVRLLGNTSTIYPQCCGRETLCYPLAALRVLPGGCPMNRVLVAIVFLFLPAACLADDLFDIKPVADGVYAAIAKPAYKLNCNAAIILLDDVVLVVDTHSKPSAARALI